MPPDHILLYTHTHTHKAAYCNRQLIIIKLLAVYILSKKRHAMLFIHHPPCHQERHCTERAQANIKKNVDASSVLCTSTDKKNIQNDIKNASTTYSKYFTIFFCCTTTNFLLPFYAKEKNVNV